MMSYRYNGQVDGVMYVYDSYTIFGIHSLCKISTKNSSDWNYYMDSVPRISLINGNKLKLCRQRLERL